MRTVVVTVVKGRAGHLARQLDGLALNRRQPAGHVVVAMDDDTVGATVARSGRPDTVVVDVTTPDGRLDVGTARNVGARAAIDSGADHLVFLDVDCIPGPDLIGRYREAAADPRHADGLLCGPVTYLPPPGPGGYAVETLPNLVDPHPVRPTPRDDAVVRTEAYELFWSLSFSVSALGWQRIGGFFTGYRGYGGEDTDFGQSAAAAGVPMWWVGGADAFHQFHPVSDPPVEHLDDILANAAVFQRRWGWWPMCGWLDQFAAAGLIRRDADGRPHRLPSDATQGAG